MIEKKRKSNIHIYIMIIIMIDDLFSFIYFVFFSSCCVFCNVNGVFPISLARSQRHLSAKPMTKKRIPICLHVLGLSSWLPARSVGQADD